MKNIKNTHTTKNHRKRKKLVVEIIFAEETPAGLWEGVYEILLRAGVFDS